MLFLNIYLMCSTVLVPYKTILFLISKMLMLFFYIYLTRTVLVPYKFQFFDCLSTLQIYICGKDCGEL